jgi:hypothetical protein
LAVEIEFPPGPKMSPEDRERVEEGINGLLQAHGYKHQAIEGWWNFVRFPELRHRTVTQAWLSGDESEVSEFVQRRLDRSRYDAKRAMGDPTFQAFIEARLSSPPF